MARGIVKRAVAVLAPSMVSLQGSVPLHASLHPAEEEPLSEVAARATEVSLLNEPKQVEPQLMPKGELVTVPLPVPTFLTARDNNGGSR